jgi:hypothetical protein
MAGASVSRSSSRPVFFRQRDVLPAALRRAPLLFVLAFAPFAVMLFWLVHLRFSQRGVPVRGVPLPVER